jgi:hypothetical protein
MSLSEKSSKTIFEMLIENRGLGSRFPENPDFIVDGYPRSANTFLVTALNISWPNMVVKSHGHDSKNLKDANGLIPVVSVIRNPIDAIASYAVHMSLYEPERINNPALLIALYGDIAKQALDNPHVFTIPFEEVVSDVVGILDMLEVKYGLKNRIHVSSEEIFSQTQDLSKQVNLTPESFIKRGHVPRDKDPLYEKALEELQNPIYAKSLSSITKIYETIVDNFYQIIKKEPNT